MKIKRLISAFLILSVLVGTVFVCDVSALTAVSVDGLPAREVGDVGIDGICVKVMSDSSFVTESRELRFFDRGAVFSSCERGREYPVLKEKFKLTETDAEAELFSFVSGYDEKTVFLNVELTLTSDLTDTPFPVPEGFVSPEVSPEVCPAGECVTRFYRASLERDGNVAEGTFPAPDRDKNYADMTRYWDSVFENSFTLSGELSEGAKSAQSLYKEYAAEKIINGKRSLCALDVFLSGESFDEDFPVSRASSVTSGMTELSSSKYLILNGGVPSLKENLEALTELKACMALLSNAGKTEEAGKIYETYEKLADSVTYALKNTGDSLPCRIEAATVRGSADNLTFTLDSSRTASDLRRWYLFDRMIPYRTDNAMLYDYAKKALVFTAFPADGISLEASLISKDPDGTLIVGRGVSASLALELAKSGTSFENFELGDTTVSGSFAIEENTLTVSVESESLPPLSLEFPFFAENIEYASCGYDYNTGIVTAPAGRDTVTVRLSVQPSEIAENDIADLALEKAMFKASLKSTEECTELSLRAFNEALDSAESAKSSIASEKMKAAEILSMAADNLSKTVSEYIYSPFYEGALGSMTYDTLYQKFTLPSTGDVTDVFVYGEYADTTDAAIYSLRGDGYTAKELKAVAEGEKADGGFVFRFDFEAEENTEYLLCIMRDGGDITLSTFAENGAGALYITGSGSVKVFENVSLGLSVTVRQADRSDLDTFYRHCLGEDVSGFTKESQNNLKKALGEAKRVLTTPSVTKKECKDTYKALQKAFSSLETYASDTKAESPPLITYILIGTVVFVLGAVSVTSVITSKKKKSDGEKEKNSEDTE